MRFCQCSTRWSNEGLVTLENVKVIAYRHGESNAQAGEADT